MNIRKDWFTTLAGLMAALGGVPILVAAAGVKLPAWWAHLIFPFILIGIIGTVLLGWAAKGADQHSTQAQVVVSTIQNPAVEKKAEVEAAIAGIDPASIVEIPPLKK